MNMSNAPKTAPRITPAYNVRWGIKAYDTDNLYPQWLLNVVGNSSTLAGCLGRYIDFIEGKGLSDQDFAAWVVNRRGETMNDIHHLCATELFYNNPCRFLGQNPKWTLKPIQITEEE